MAQTIPDSQPKRRGRSKLKLSASLLPVAPSDEERLLTKRELCEFARCSPKYIELEVKAGHLRVLKMSLNMARYRWGDVKRWLESKAV